MCSGGRSRPWLSGVDFVAVRLGYAAKTAGCAALFAFAGQGPLARREVKSGMTFSRGDHVTYLGACVHWVNIYIFPQTAAGTALGATRADVDGFAACCS